jgi:hypothetical protein
MQRPDQFSARGSKSTLDLTSIKIPCFKVDSRHLEIRPIDTVAGSELVLRLLLKAKQRGPGGKRDGSEQTYALLGTTMR